MSPTEQLVIMYKQEETQNAQNEYSESDLEVRSSELSHRPLEIILLYLIWIHWQS